MNEIIKAIGSLEGTSVPTLAIVAGVIFLFFALTGGYTGKFKIPRDRQKLTGVIGFSLVLIGITLFVIPSVTKEPPLKCIPYILIGEPEVDGLSVSVNGIVDTQDGCPETSPIYWDWGDQTSKESFLPAQHVYSEPGEYTITATIEDQLGNIDTEQVVVVVPSISQPQTVATPDQESNFTGSFTTWTRKAENSSLARYSHSGAFDSHRGVFVIFGGRIDDESLLSETLEYDGENLKRVDTPQSPQPRIWHGMAYDSSRGLVVLFGGTQIGISFADTWEFDGSDWTQMITKNSPPPRHGFGMTYDSCRQKIVIFGGDGANGRLSDTWEYDGTDWTEINTINLPPPARSSTSMVFDSHRCVSVLFGGAPSSYEGLSDTWEYDGTNWVELDLSQPPLGRWGHDMAYDPTEGIVILYGGYGEIYPEGEGLEDSWSYDGQNWIQLFPNKDPGPISQLTMVYDTERNRALIFGRNGDIWEFEN